jgi:hypothetical protein
MGDKDLPLPARTTRAEGDDGEIFFDGQFVACRCGNADSPDHDLSR